MRYFYLNVIGVMGLMLDLSMSCERCVMCTWLRVLSFLVLYCVSSWSRIVRCGSVSQSCVKGPVCCDGVDWMWFGRGLCSKILVDMSMWWRIWRLHVKG
jgi:hypothetical protein